MRSNIRRKRGAAPEIAAAANGGAAMLRAAPLALPHFEAFRLRSVHNQSILPRVDIQYELGISKTAMNAIVDAPRHVHSSVSSRHARFGCVSASSCNLP